MPLDQIHRMSDVLAYAVTGLLGDLEGQRRLAREFYANHGRYGDILRGWSAQGELVRRRLVQEVLARRLRSARGADLRDLAQSEFRAALPDEPRASIGAAVIRREVTSASSSSTGNFAQLVVPVRTRFRRPANPTFPVPLEEALYESAEAVVAGTDDTEPVTGPVGGVYTHAQQLSVPIVATRTGPHANTPVLSNASLADGPRLADAVGTFTCLSLEASGGTAGVVDAQLEALARTLANGLDGPTIAAAVAGCLTNPGVRYVAAGRNAAAGTLRLYLADESWASAARWRSGVHQALKDFPWIGFGMRVDVVPVQSRAISVKASVLLRSSRYDSEKSAITAAIREALQGYFDLRPDWWTWRTSTLGGVVSQADPRILACTSVSVLDYATAAAISEPTSTPGPAAELIHYTLVRQGADITYSTPG